MIDLVLCFVSEERDRVVPLLDALKAGGWRVGRLGVGAKGARLSAEVRANLGTARLVVVAWTAEGARRPALGDAVAVAQGAGTLLVARLDAVDPPDGPVVDLSGTNGAPAALVEAVRKRLADVTSPAPSAQAAAPSAPPPLPPRSSAPPPSPTASAPPPPRSSAPPTSPPPRPPRSSVPPSPATSAPPPLPQRATPPPPEIDDPSEEPTADGPPRIVPPQPRVGSRAVVRPTPSSEAAAPAPRPRPVVRPAVEAPTPAPSSRPEAPRRNVAPLLMGVAVMLVALVVAAGFLWPHLRGPSHPLPAHVAAASTAPIAETTHATAEGPAQVASAPPDRVAAARRARLAGGDPEVARLVELGWAEARRSSWSRALEHFVRVDVLSPGHPDAAWGLGYVDLHRGRPEDGRRALCRARQGVSAVEREALRSLLAERGMACD